MVWVSDVTLAITEIYIQDALNRSCNGHSVVSGS